MHSLRKILFCTAFCAGAACNTTTLPSDAGNDCSPSCTVAADCPTLTCTCQIDGQLDAGGASSSTQSVPGVCTDGCCAASCPPFCT